MSRQGYIYKMYHPEHGLAYVGQRVPPEGVTPLEDVYTGSGDYIVTHTNKHGLGGWHMSIIALGEEGKELNHLEYALIMRAKEEYGDMLLNIRSPYYPTYEYEVSKNAKSLCGRRGYAYKNVKNKSPNLAERKMDLIPEQQLPPPAAIAPESRQSDWRYLELYEVKTGDYHFVMTPISEMVGENDPWELSINGSIVVNNFNDSFHTCAAMIRFLGKGLATVEYYKDGTAEVFHNDSVNYIPWYETRQPFHPPPRKRSGGWLSKLFSSHE